MKMMAVKTARGGLRIRRPADAIQGECCGESREIGEDIDNQVLYRVCLGTQVERDAYLLAEAGGDVARYRLERQDADDRIGGVRHELTVDIGPTGSPSIMFPNSTPGS